MAFFEALDELLRDADSVFEANPPGTHEPKHPFKECNRDIEGRGVIGEDWSE